MPEDKELSGAAKMFGDFAPGLVGFTDDVLFGQVWERKEMTPMDRSLVTVVCLVTSQCRSACGSSAGQSGCLAMTAD